jgi:hypothetical protein
MCGGLHAIKQAAFSWNFGEFVLQQSDTISVIYLGIKLGNHVFVKISL